MLIPSIIGTVAAVLTTSAFLPQAFKTIKTKSTGDLSLSTFLLIFTGTFLWFIYGLFLVDYPMIFANAITFVLAGIIVFMKLRSNFNKKQ